MRNIPCKQLERRSQTNVLCRGSQGSHQDPAQFEDLCMWQALTWRGWHELPQSLRFHPHYLAYVSEAKVKPCSIVSPSVGEWLMGLPEGWTGEAPLREDVVAKIGCSAKFGMCVLRLM